LVRRIRISAVVHLMGCFVVGGLLLGNSDSSDPLHLREVGELKIDQWLPGSICPLPFPFDVMSRNRGIAVKTIGEHDKSRWMLAVIDSHGRAITGGAGAFRGDFFDAFLRFSKDGERLLTDDGMDLVANDTKTMAALWRITGDSLDEDREFTLSLRSVGVSPNGRYVAVSYWETQRTTAGRGLKTRPRLEEPRLYIFDAESGRQISECVPPVKSGDAVKVAVSSDGKSVAIIRQFGARTSDRPNIFVLHTADCNQVRSWTYPYPPSSVSFQPDNKSIVVGLGDGPSKAEELNVEDGRVSFAVPEPATWGRDRPMALSHDGRWLAIASGRHKRAFFNMSEKWMIADPGIEVWDLREKRLAASVIIAKQADSEAWIPVPRFSPDDKILAVSGPDCTIHFYEWHPGE